ncbi:MAG: tyrosine-protein phosphatase [Anaerolineales bacterium]|nr:tyrosine-protein phosphatase [Anaerolineales bacterium]
MYNLRHVGGYETRNGRFTRPNAFFRADSLHRLDASGQQQLLTRGVRTIIDLRDRAEQQELPNPLADSAHVDYRFMPLYTHWDDLAAGTTEVIGVAQYYALLLSRCGPSFAEVFAVMAQPEAFSVLVHCAAGKDRTGLVVALLLELAGVPDETIVADYALSYGYLQPVLDEFRARGVADGFTAEEYEQILLSPAPVMRQTLACLHQEHGGARAYLHQHGLSEQQLDNLVEQVLS